MRTRKSQSGKHSFCLRCFNGAASLRTRKWGYDYGKEERVVGFNGAASLRTRKSSVGINNTLIVSCFNGAASLRTRK